MAFIIKSWNKNGKVSNLAKSIRSGPVYSQKEQNWNGSFSQSIFQSSETQVVISQQIYENYIDLLNFSKMISSNGIKGVCELPFIWIGKKDVVNGETVIKITNNILYPIILNDDKNSFIAKGDLDYKLIKAFLLKLQTDKNGVELKNLPPFNFQNCANDSTAGGIRVTDQIDELLKNFETTENLVIVAGHTHPAMTRTSINSTNYTLCPNGTNPQSFGLGTRGFNLSTGDLESWNSCINHDCFDNGVTFIGGNICHNGDLNLLIYEGNDPKMARTIFLLNNQKITIQTSRYNEIARNNYLNYKSNAVEMDS